MTKVIGVRFRRAGKIYYFSPGKLKIDTGDHVIVETARGVEYGHVVIGTREVEDDRVVQPLKSVIRLSTPEDDDQENFLFSPRNLEKFTAGFPFSMLTSCVIL